MVKFNKDQDEILVKCVAKRPPIYYPRIMDYKDLNIRDAIWNDISGNLGRSGKQNIVSKKYFICINKNV